MSRRQLDAYEHFEQVAAREGVVNEPPLLEPEIEPEPAPRISRRGRERLNGTIDPHDPLQILAHAVAHFALVFPDDPDAGWHDDLMRMKILALEALDPDWSDDAGAIAIREHERFAQEQRASARRSVRKQVRAARKAQRNAR